MPWNVLNYKGSYILSCESSFSVPKPRPVLSFVLELKNNTIEEKSNNFLRREGTGFNLTNSCPVHLHPHTRFVIPFHWNETNKMSGDWSVQIALDHFISVSVASKVLQGKNRWALLYEVYYHVKQQPK